MLPIGRLHRRLAQNIVATLELPEKLIVEIIAIGQHHQRRILHRRLPDQTSGVEQHRKTLAAALRVPDHTSAPVARLAAVHAADPVLTQLLA